MKSPVLAAVALLALIGCGNGGDAPVDAEITFVVHVPPSTPTGADVYLTSNLASWDPAAPAYRLTEVDALTYRISLVLPEGTALEYKFTRGSWATVEKGDGGVEIGNRQYQVNGPASLDLTVMTWADML